MNCKTAQRSGVLYDLTQLISGHGYFKYFLFKIDKASTADCMYCPSAKDDAEHTFYVCKKWADQKRALEEVVGQQRPDNFKETELQGHQEWTN